MAVCGRCWLCGYKFDCSGADELVRWRCAPCDREHAICVHCHGVLEDGHIHAALRDLVALLEARSEGG